MRKLLSVLICSTSVLILWLYLGPMISTLDDAQAGQMGEVQIMEGSRELEPSGISIIEPAMITPMISHGLVTGTRIISYISNTATEQWMPTALTIYGIAALAVDPLDPSTVYAASSTNSRFYKTTNGGESWTQVYFNIGSYYTLAIDPVNRNIVYAGNYGYYGILKTIDGGSSWFALPSIKPLADATALIVDPTNTTTVYAGFPYGWGVYKTTNGGVSWSNVLSTTYVTSLAMPTNTSLVYAGTKNYNAVPGGVIKSVDGGVNWTRALSYNQVNYVAIDPVNPSVVYAGLDGGGVVRSVDGGANWISVIPGHDVRALAIHPINSSIVYAGTYDAGVFKSTNSGTDWISFNDGLTNTFVLSLAIDPMNGSVLYAGTQGGGIFKAALAPPPPPPGSTYAHVVNENGQSLAGVQIHRNGYQVPGVTDAAGNLILNSVQVGDTLVAMTPVYTQPTVRQNHGGWAYRVYKTNLTVQNNGSLQPFTVVTPTGSQMLVVKASNASVLFNLVVSIEWDADDAYMRQIANAIQNASDYLYDLTDGQMAFGQVHIYDNGQSWADADIQISTKNIVHPHAYIGGITSNDKSHVIRIGRGWNGNSGNEGSWAQPAGFRTLVHEFGHYGLYLYDEYFAYTYDQSGNLTGEVSTFCTGPENRNPATEATNASVMDYQYTTTELSAQGVPGLWSSLCEQTAQWQFNGESTWETLSRKYADTNSPFRWRLMTPADRGAVKAGPTHLPTDVLSLPKVTIENSGLSGPSRPLMVEYPEGQGYWGALVALYKKNGRVIGQGISDGSGRLIIYGADVGDTLRAASIDGGLAGSVTVGLEPSLTLALVPVTRLTIQSTSAIPHMRVLAEPSQGPGQIELLISLHNFGSGADPGVIITDPTSEAGYAPTLGYSPGTDTYEGQISFSATERGMGRVQAVGAVGNNLVRLQSTYRLQQVFNSHGNDVYSDDGNLNLHLEPGSLPGSEAYFVVMPPGAVPGPPPAGFLLVGDPYDITASGALVVLEQPGMLTLHYDGALVTSSSAPEGMGIYRWDPNSETWLEVMPSSLDGAQKAMAAPVTALGTYALLAPAGSWIDPPLDSIFLPIIVKAVP